MLKIFSFIESLVTITNRLMLVREKYKVAYKRLHNTSPHIRTLYVFNALSLLAGTIYGMYYGVFLYKNTFSLSVLALDGLLGGFGIWLGYLIGVRLIQRRGYGASIRMAFVLWAGIAFCTMAITNHISEWFVIIAIIKALPAGIYAAVGDAIMLRDIKTKARSGFLQLNLAFEFFVSIILPPLVGAMISFTGGYELAFASAGFVYMLSFFIKCKLPKPSVSFNIKEVIHVFKRPLYMEHALNRTAAAGFNQLNAFALTIIPFLLLNSEFSMGLATSLSALTAAMIALCARKIDHKHHLKLGYSAYGVRSVAALIFVMVWSAPAMIIWQLIGKLVTPFHDPLQKSIDIDNDALIMGKDVKQKALEINVLNNTLVLIGTTIAFGSFLLITSVSSSQQQIILQALIMAYVAWRFINLGISVWINKLVKESLTYVPLHHQLRMRIQKRFA